MFLALNMTEYGDALRCLLGSSGNAADGKMCNNLSVASGFPSPLNLMLVAVVY